ncbi:hypothetical protein A7W90_16250 [Clostridium sp. Bc-iso-3]|nr:hypothetical protein A7W90_16250 [Clostridium sp. Bc-iso-3]
MRLKVLAPDCITELGVINDTYSSDYTEEINGIKELSFTTILTKEVGNLINDVNVIEHDGDLFDIAAYKKQQSGMNLRVDAECEHISYRLNDPEYDVEYFTEIGTPEEILEKILAGTDFTVGAVEFYDTVTYSAQEAKSRRALLMEFVDYIGGEADFNGFEVSILIQRGSPEPKNLTAGRNIAVISKNVNKRERDELGNPVVAYECELIRPMELNLGDVVALEYERLDIDISLRIVSITKNPYNRHEVRFQVGNKIPGIQDDMYRIQTTTVAKNKVYNGTRIGPDEGFVSERSDKMAKMAANATEGFKLYLGDGSGSVWEAAFYVVIEDGVPRLYLGGNAEFQGIVKASDLIGGTINIGEGTFLVDFEGNMTAMSATIQGLIESSEIKGSTITGGVFRTAESGARVELSDNRIKTYNEQNALNGLVSNNEEGSNYGDVHFYDNGLKVFEIYNYLNGEGVAIRPVNGSRMDIGANNHNSKVYGNVTFSGNVGYPINALTRSQTDSKTDWIPGQFVYVTDDPKPSIGSDLSTDISSVTASALNATNQRINEIIAALEYLGVIDRG